MSYPKEADCKRAQTTVYDVVPQVYGYAHRKGLSERPLREYEEDAALWEDFPEEWEDIALGMLVGHAVCGSVRRVGAFLRAMKEELPPRQYEVARLWRDRPWVFAFFEIAGEPSFGLLRIRPLGKQPSVWSTQEDWEELLFYSKQTAERYHHGATLFFGQLVDAGPAFVSQGVVIPFMSLEPDDPSFFADVLQSGLDPSGDVSLLGVNSRGRALTDAAGEDPAAFLALLRYSETPQIRNRAGTPGRFCGLVELDVLGKLLEESTWREHVGSPVGETLDFVSDERGAAIYLRSGSPMQDPAIYVSRETARVFLTGFTESAYERGRTAAAGIVDFPERPQVRASATILVAASFILGYNEELTSELLELQAHFDGMVDEAGPGATGFEAAGPEAPGPRFRTPSHEEPVQEEEHLPESIEQLQAIADRLIHNHNEGIREDDEAVSAALGIDPRIVTHVRGQLEKSLSGVFGENEEAAPAADRFGLSPRAFTELTRAGVPRVEGALVLRDTEEIAEAEALVRETPIYRFMSWFIGRAVEEGGIPATDAGYVSPRIIAAAYDEHRLRQGEPFGEAADLRERFRPKKEADWPQFRNLRELAETAGLLRLSGKRFVAQTGTEELLSQPVALYRLLLEVMFTRFEWAASARLGTVPELRERAGFLFYAAAELSEAGGEPEAWIPVERLSDRFIASVPAFAAAARAEAGPSDPGRNESGGNEPATAAFGIREFSEILIDVHLITAFAEIFGLVEVDTASDAKRRFRLTPLFRAVFRR
jgi:hypothetical protein